MEKFPALYQVPAKECKEINQGFRRYPLSLYPFAISPVFHRQFTGKSKAILISVALAQFSITIRF
jgi:hypothetical protein